LGWVLLSVWLATERLAVLDVSPADLDTDLPVTVETVSDASDLTGIGINVTQLVKQAADSENPTVVCFDSLTPLLQYVDAERCYRFLDVTTSRLSKVCAVSHAHINPRAHDDQTVQQLTTVFDTIIEHDGDDWAVRPA
jgi:archaellum biogenesis ATPase FlaH